jgi:hypothetical protein
LIDIKPNLQAAILQIEEAKRIGKCPWCCCAITEQYVYDIMNPNGLVKDGIVYRIVHFPQETFAESQKRWREEGVITEKQYKRAVSIKVKTPKMKGEIK